MEQLGENKRLDLKNNLAIAAGLFGLIVLPEPRIPIYIYIHDDLSKSIVIPYISQTLLLRHWVGQPNRLVQVLVAKKVIAGGR